jgi:hypothetical protein
MSATMTTEFTLGRNLGNAGSLPLPDLSAFPEKPPATIGPFVVLQKGDDMFQAPSDETVRKKPRLEHVQRDVTPRVLFNSQEE